MSDKKDGFICFPIILKHKCMPMLHQMLFTLNFPMLTRKLRSLVWSCL